MRRGWVGMDVNEESCSCVYSCETDAECGDGAVCACIAGITGIARCVPASCTTTDDCGGGGNPICEPGVTLSAGDYTVGIGGTSLTVKFTVPSHVSASELCASNGEP